jgi:rhamnose utilization protein RhaD (predicted bifunctional aldolase and dehydrogenase)/NAD(P)-dependent dehydrogenase (short-subunit alcohol dehydrogenase family)
MINRWQSQNFESDPDELLKLRVYSSQVLGQEEDLVLHGGGNTSVKGSLTNVFGEKEQVLFVKGSGWDLRTIEAAGFPPVRLEYLLKLGELPELGDTEMMKHLRLALLDPGAPTPSVEAILHALIPFQFVDHSHADAVVTISNTERGEERIRQVYGDEVLVLPYTMPGFILAKQVAEACRDIDWSSLRGIVLLHHGIFTFSNDAKTSYDNMIELVSKAEDFLKESCGEEVLARATFVPGKADCLGLARFRRQAGNILDKPALVRLDHSAEASGFANIANCGELACRGPLTPDHTIHAKAFAAVLDEDTQTGLEQFVADYQSYFEEFSEVDHQILDTMPRYAIWKEKGMVYLAGNHKRLQIVDDISRHTIQAIQYGEALGGWKALPRQDLFDVEYWELEQAKLKSSAKIAEFEGKVAVISGAASGIGRACVDKLLANGAVVIALDIAQGFEESFSSPAVLAIHCDVTDKLSIEQALQNAVCRFGGIDVLVSNAGNFPPSQTIESLDEENWNQSLDLNVSSHMKLIQASVPYLRNGFDPAIVIIASKNVPAPGPGAAAYSAAKAALTQLARVAALELGVDGIRVNTIHPNAIYDTEIWTDEVIAQRASHYGMTVEQYKTSNVLGTELRSEDVAQSVLLFAGIRLSKTTGAQLAVDGGNERVI